MQTGKILEKHKPDLIDARLHQIIRIAFKPSIPTSDELQLCMFTGASQRLNTLVDYMRHMSLHRFIPSLSSGLDHAK